MVWSQGRVQKGPFSEVSRSTKKVEGFSQQIPIIKKEILNSKPQLCGLSSRLLRGNFDLHLYLDPARTDLTSPYFELFWQSLQFLWGTAEKTVLALGNQLSKYLQPGPLHMAKKLPLSIITLLISSINTRQIRSKHAFVFWVLHFLV